MNQNDFMHRALHLARRSLDNGGGPFGAVIVRDGLILAEGNNRVTATPDPTAHAEVVAIRKAALAIENFDLSGCEIYTSCEPCPMCLASIYWARLDNIWFAGSRHDAADAGFDDAFLYDEIAAPMNQRRIPIRQVLAEDAMAVFATWRAKPDKVDY